MCSHVVEHLQSMVEIILVTAAIYHLDTGKRKQFGKNQFEQTAIAHQAKSARRFVGSHHLHHFLHYPFTGNYRYTVLVAFNGSKGFWIDIEIQLSGKPDCTHHPQRVVAESDVGIEGCADDFAFQVANAIKRVDESAVRVGIY